MQAWLDAGQLKLREDRVEGLENAAEAFIGLLEGRNFGKLTVRWPTPDDRPQPLLAPLC